ncbi:MAG TPA: hypothetical protein VFU02_03360, partial [Polyangiaceae bacterium]|nr:hypothetical protein [Polyangiaceae bacterium]
MSAQTAWVRQKQLPLSLLVYGLLGLAAPTAGCGDGGESASGAPPGSFHVRPTTNLPGARRFLILAEPGEVPAVADQLTARGRSVGTLAPFGSHIFLGFGDFSNNTGPIRAVSYDVQTGRFQTGVPLETEEILDFQVHAGRLFAAALDPLGDEALGSVFRLDSADAWRAMPDIPDAVHTFGMAEFRGQLFVGTGCVQGGKARVAVTNDSGENWYDSHITPGTATAFARYTHLGATDRELFVSGRIHGEPSMAFAYVWDGERWD